MQDQPRIDDPDYPDPIVEEIRAVRHRLAAECGNDLDRIFAKLTQRERESGRTYAAPVVGRTAPVLELPAADARTASND